MCQGKITVPGPLAVNTGMEQARPTTWCSATKNKSTKETQDLESYPMILGFHFEVSGNV